MPFQRTTPVNLSSLARNTTRNWAYHIDTLHPTPTPPPYIPPRIENFSPLAVSRRFRILIMDDDPSILGTRECSLDYLEPLGFYARIKFRLRYNWTTLRRSFRQKWHVLRDFLEARFGSDYVDESARTDISIPSYGTIDFRYTPEDDFYL